MSETYRLPEELRTRRLVLRRTRVADAEAIFRAYATDPEVTRYLGWLPHDDIAQTEAFLHAISGDWDAGAAFPLVVIETNADGRLLGMIHPKLRGATVNYGYVLRRDSWGQGYASEMLCHLVDHALASPGVHRAEAFCDLENRASARVMEKAGMRFEGVLRRYFVHPNVSPEPRDCAMYARVKAGATGPV